MDAGHVEWTCPRFPPAGPGHGPRAEAAELLEEADRLNVLRGTEGNPAGDRIFLAMCRFQLGEREEARDLLAECVPLIDDLELSFSRRHELRSFLREAERLVGGAARDDRELSLGGRERRR